MALKDIWGAFKKDFSEITLGLADKFDEAIQIEEKLPETVAHQYDQTGDHFNEIEYHKEALAIAERHGNNDEKREAYLKLGELYYQNGKYRLSMEHLIEFLRFGCHDPAEKALAMNYLGLCYSSIDQYKKAIPYYEECLELFQHLGDIEKVAETNANLGIAYSKEKIYDKAIKSLNTTIGISDGKFQDVEQAVNYQLGCVYQNMNEHETAVTFYLRSLQLAKELKDNTKIASAYCALGEIDFIRCLYQPAIKNYEKCLKNAKKAGDGALIALAYENLGGSYSNDGQPKKAIESFKQCMIIANEQTELADLHLKLGKAYTSSNEYETAIDHFRKSLELVNDKNTEGEIYECLGVIYHNDYQYQAAEKHYKDALQIANDQQNRELQARVDIKLGNLFLVQENPTEAFPYFYEAVEIAQNVENKESLADAYRGWGNAFHSDSSFQEAIDKHTKSLELAKHDRKREQDAHECLGDDFFALQNWSEANKCYSSSCSIAKEDLDMETVYRLKKKLGEICEINNDYDKALVYYKSCLDLAENDEQKNTEVRIAMYQVRKIIGDNCQENDDYANAIIHHKICLEIAQELEDKSRIAESYRVIASSYANINQPQRSLEFYDQYLEKLADSETNISELTAFLLPVFLEVGELCAKYNDPQKVISFYQKCFDLGGNMFKRKALGLLADAYYDKHDYEEALVHYREHLNHAGPDEQHQIYYKLGKTAFFLNNLNEAFINYFKALELAQDLADPDMEIEASICEALGDAYFSKSDYKNAIEYHLKHVEFANFLEKDIRKQRAFQSLANAYSANGEWVMAIENYWHSRVVANDEAALQKCEAFIEANARALKNSCDKYTLNGDYDKALEMQTKYLEVATKIGDSAQEGSANCNIAEVHMANGQYMEAVRFSRSALQIAENDARRAKANGILGCAHSALGKYIESERFHRTEIGIVEASGEKSGIARANGNVGVALLGKGDPEKAVVFFRIELKLAEDIHDKMEESRANENLGSYHADIGNCKEAIEYYQKFLSIAEEIGDKAGIGRAKGAIGMMLTEMGHYQNAIKYHEEEKMIAQELRNEVRRGRALGNLGKASTSLCDYENAIAFQKQSLKIAEDNHVQGDERRAYENLGNAHLASGQYRKALECQDKALRLSQQLGHKAAEGRIHQNMAKSYHLSGQIGKAIDLCKKALAIAKEVGDRAGQGRALGTMGRGLVEFGQNKQEASFNCREYLRISKDLSNKADEENALANMAAVLIEIGQYGKALQCCHGSLDIAKSLQDEGREGRAYGNLGKFYMAVGQYEEAIKNHQDHLRIARKLGDKAEIGKANGDLGDAYNKNGQHEQAMKCHSEDKDIAKELGNQARVGRAQGNMGNTYALMEQFERAYRCYLERLNIAEKLNDKSSLARALLGLGEYHMNHDHFNEAIEKLNRLLDISLPNDLDSLELTAIAQEMLGQCYRHSCIPKACSFFAKSIINFKRNRNSLGDMDQFNISLSNRNAHVHKLLFESMLNLQNKITALVVSDCGKAQALCDLTWKMSNHSIVFPFISFDPMETIAKDPSSSNLETLLNDSLFNVLHSRQADSIISYAFGEDEELHSWVISQGVSHKRLKIDHKMSMKDFSNRHISLLKEHLGLRNAKKDTSQEDDRAAYAAIEMTECNPVFSMTDEILSGGKDYPKKSANGNSFQKNDPGNNQSPLKPNILPPNAPYKVDLQDLYAALIQPIEEHLHGSKLLIVPEGPLFTLPFAALLDSSGNYLCDKYSLQFIPSLNFLDFCLSRQSAALGHALFVGNPKIRIAEVEGQTVKLEELPNAEQEVIECGKYFRAQPLVQRMATKENVLKQMANASVVHIAAHGYFKRAEIFLAPNERSPHHPSSYLLTAEDIQRCFLNARLVVLSCCDSGRGEISSEGVVGIARSFLGSGARAVVVALWQINDLSTMEFMIEFYCQILMGFSVCGALQRTMVALKIKYSSPSAWAAFQVVGEDITFSREEIEEIRQLSALR
ncbi:tetratricopeptide repeat protein 28-like [Dendronephthya gigantea]|uniref:tetratricopeptide repeat protein 28-like n=1 Tax=Dendronephthya gigantea TaxID=151771 RepID=UPI00106D2861|nr:tetratricopeptide repeat protein 28-like [Dendronephthya gigantea]